MNLIISIKPQFVSKIISKEKKYEFRKNVPKKPVEKIFIYSTVPDKEIVGYFECDKVIEDTPDNLWNNFSNDAGISKQNFFEYFLEKEKGFAMEISKLTLFKDPIDVDDICGFVAPQSFKYADYDF